MDNPFFTPDELRAFQKLDPNDRTSRKPGLGWLRAQNRPIYIFGYGKIGRRTYDAIGRDLVHGWLDNDKDKWNQSMDGLPVFSPVEAGSRLRNENALVILAVYNEMAAELLRQQCEKFGYDYIYYMDVMNLLEHPLPIGKLAENSCVLECFSILADEESKQVFRSAIRYRTTFNMVDFPKNTRGQYFVDFIPRVCYRNFVDVGAYDGDTLREYLSRFGNDFDSYIAIEPDPDKMFHLRETAGADSRITIAMFAASNHSGTLPMTKVDSMLVANPSGAILSRTEELDVVLRDRRVGLIKMDIEGSEPEALAGATKTIREQRPALAISVYHRNDHLWQIPLWIQELNLGYGLFFRHHSHGCGETICYAAPYV